MQKVSRDWRSVMLATARRWWRQVSAWAGGEGDKGSGVALLKGRDAGDLAEGGEGGQEAEKLLLFAGDAGEGGLLLVLPEEGLEGKGEV